MNHIDNHEIFFDIYELYVGGPIYCMCILTLILKKFKN